MIDPRATESTFCALLPGGQSCALEFAPIGIAVIDPHEADAPLSYVNAEFCAITGYQPQEIIGRPLSMLYGPKTDHRQIAHVAGALAEHRTVCEEVTCYRKSGASFVMRLDVRPVFGPDGALQAFVGGCSDMTLQRSAQQALSESEERLRAVMTAIPLPMLTLRHDGTIARANAAADETLRMPAGSLPGRSVWDFVDPAACPEAVVNLCAEARFEVPAHRADGELMWTLASAKTYTVRGETRTLVVFQDVSELKRKERALTEANEEAERNIRARMRFLAAASHDLRQPLQAMALFASALDHHVDSPQGHTIVQSLKTSLRGMEEMFDSLLDMSKLDAGVMKAEPRAFLVNDVLEQMEMIYAAQAEAAGLRLRVVPSSATIYSDPRLLARIIGNFISNAIRYTPKGCVLIGVRRHGANAAICVLDTGPGIPESQRLEIFREFSQGANAPGRERGTGLGLAIVQRLSMLLGHRVGVQSNPGRGSAFCVNVPLADEDSATRPDTTEDEDSREVAGATVMVVDDDRNIQDGLGMLLREWGCCPLITGSAEEALSAVTTTPAIPDVILADVHLRGNGGGLAAIRAVRTHIGREIPAFLFTGDTEYPAEADDVRVLRKPLDPLRLRSVLADALGR